MAVTPADADAEARVREALEARLRLDAPRMTPTGRRNASEALTPAVLAAIREAYDKGCDLNEGWDYALDAAVRALSSPDTEEGER